MAESKNKSEETVNASKKAEFQTLTVHGTKYKTYYTKKYQNRKKWERLNEKHELSFIPGTILKIYVKNGQEIKKNQPLLILEAMKMENTIFAPFDGKIKKVHVNQGDRIPNRTLMIEYE